MKMLAAVLLLSLPLLADASDIAPPPVDRPVADLAQLLGASAAERIARTCAMLQREKGVPLAVVTIRSMREYGESGSIDSFALRLLAAWQYDSVEADGRRWEKGILFLVSVGDRRCRIEPGTGWGTGKNAECTTILETSVLPEFRSKDFEGGIVAGVEALDSMARGNAVPAPRNKTSYAWVIGLVILVLSVTSFVRRGTHGVAWPIWRGGFSALGWILLILASSRGHRRRGYWGGSMGGFGGGFGGGFSRGGGGGFSRGGGGRGATGSW